MHFLVIGLPTEWSSPLRQRYESSRKPPWIAFLSYYLAPSFGGGRYKGLLASCLGRQVGKNHTPATNHRHAKQWKFTLPRKFKYSPSWIHQPWLFFLTNARILFCFVLFCNFLIIYIYVYSIHFGSSCCLEPKWTQVYTYRNHHPGFFHCHKAWDSNSANLCFTVESSCTRLCFSCPLLREACRKKPRTLRFLASCSV